MGQMQWDALSRIRKQAEESARRSREAEQRRKEEERRRKEEEERRRQEEERARQKREAEQRRKEEERRRKEAEERAKQAALEAAQFGWQPPQMQKQAGEKEGAPQAQGKPYARTLMDNVLAHEGDTDDPFLMELNRDSWEQEYKDGRTKAFRDAVGQLADRLMTGKAKPVEEFPVREGREATVTSGDLADPFLQGLFGEEELKKEFVKGQMEQFTPALERRIAQLRDKVNPSSARRESPLGEKVSGQTEEVPQKDTAYGTNMVYTMDKDGKQPTREELVTGRTEIGPKMAGNIGEAWPARFADGSAGNMIQPMPAGVSDPPQGDDKKASLEAAQFGWQPPQGNAEQIKAGETQINRTVSLQPAEDPQREKSYSTLPEEMEPLYDIMGKDNNDGTVNIEGIKQNFGDCIIADENGNAVPGEDGKAQVKEEYKEQLAKDIAKKYGNQLTEKEKQRLLDAACFIIAQEGQKQNFIKNNPENILDITDTYNAEMKDYMDRPGVWIWDMLSEVGGNKVGSLNLKNNPEAIEKMCGGQIPQNIIEYAKELGGEEGVAYLQGEGYGYFKVGNRVMNAEELGNYTLGLLAEQKGYSPNLVYSAATIDNVKNRMFSPSEGLSALLPENHVTATEMYDKYFQRMGVEDARR